MKVSRQVAERGIKNQRRGQETPRDIRLFNRTSC